MIIPCRSRSCILSPRGHRKLRWYQNKKQRKPMKSMDVKNSR
nr:MAG TPA: hypothetical protein [Caudoviricetes sp.]